MAPPNFILDATADRFLLSEAMHLTPGLNTEAEAEPQWPDNVHVHQWADDLVSRQTLGVRSDVGSSTSEDRITRQCNRR